MHTSLLKKSFLAWLPFAALITFVCILGYGLVQQDLRQTANDPQIQIAEDIAQAITSGVAGPQDVVPPGQIVDVAGSLDPYVMVFDASGKVLASSAILNGTIPSIPQGVFESMKKNGEDRFSWQPEIGVRSAVVVDSFSITGSSTTGFVLAGRSLREVELRENNMSEIAALAWVAGLIVMFFVMVAVIYFDKKFNQ